MAKSKDKAPELICVGERVIVRRVELSEKFGGDSGIIVKPQEVHDRTCVGVIIDTGPLCAWAENGQHVFYHRHSGFEIYGIDGYTDCRCMNERDLLGVVENLK